MPGYRRLARLASFAAFVSLGAWAGGGSFGEPDDHSPDEGPSYFGFVKDERGVPVRDAKVTVSYKKSLSLVTRSNVVGAYRVRGFKKEISPDDVTVSCEKEGYKLVRVMRRPPLKGKPVRSVETECRLQRQ